MSRLKNTENLVKLEFPTFRYYYFKREETIGDKKWAHFEQKAWKQQVAYFKYPNIQSDNIEDSYVWEDIEGNVKQVSLEEFNKGLKYPVQSRT